MHKIGSMGHTFGVRVQKVQKVQRVQKGKVLRIDRPYGPEGS